MNKLKAMMAEHIKSEVLPDFGKNFLLQKDFEPKYAALVADNQDHKT